MEDADPETDFESEPIARSQQDHSGLDGSSCRLSFCDLTDEQWVLLGPFPPKPTRRTDGRGRPWRENRAVLNGILWILRTGAPWADPPDPTPIKRATGGFSSGCARVPCEAFSGPRPGSPRRRLSGFAGNLHRWELRTSEAGRCRRGKTKRGRARRSWRSPIAADSRSRFTSRVQRRTKSP